jgi:hypothetical protein
MRFCYANISSVFFDLKKAYDTAWRYDTARTLPCYNIRDHLSLFLPGAYVFAFGLQMFCLRVIPKKMEYNEELASA